MGRSFSRDPKLSRLLDCVRRYSRIYRNTQTESSYRIGPFVIHNRANGTISVVNAGLRPAPFYLVLDEIDVVMDYNSSASWIHAYDELLPALEQALVLDRLASIR